MPLDWWNGSTYIAICSMLSCCHSTAPLECRDVNSTSSLIQQLLHDVMVACGTCKSSMKAISYASHCYGTTDRKCNLLVKSCMHQMLNANKNCMQIPTGGTVSVNVILNLTLICHIQPLKMVRISTPSAPLSELSDHTTSAVFMSFRRHD